ncbi:MAG: aminotransferase class I/II-fold pyridoxal phosphate-dependent enzyme [Leeuwenhoekiella sp.]
MKHNIDSSLGRELISDGKSYLYFGGTSYLGLQNNTEFQEILIKNIRKYGTNYGASRKANVQFSVYEKAENYLADFVGSEACVTLSSGYLAGQMVSGYFNNAQYKVFYAPNAHPALYQSHGPENRSYTELNIAIRKYLALENEQKPVLFLDSIDFTGLNYPDFEGLQTLPLDKIIVVADDSHGIGIVGENGNGVFKIIKEFKPKELIVCSSLGKSLAAQAGAIFGSRTRIEDFKNSSFFGGASPASPANLATVLSTKDIFSRQLKKLRQNIKLFVRQCDNPDRFIYLKNHPVFSYQNTDLSRFLADNYVIVTSFNYPKPDSPVVNKIVLTVAHINEDINKLAELVNKFNQHPTKRPHL